MDWTKLFFDLVYGGLFMCWGYTKTNDYLTKKVDRFFDEVE
jgi:hypothetical protein